MCACVCQYSSKKATRYKMYKRIFCLRKFQEYLSHLVIVTYELYYQQFGLMVEKHDIYKKTNKPHSNKLNKAFISNYEIYKHPKGLQSQNVYSKH